jgi:hypothetical protein
MRLVFMKAGQELFSLFGEKPESAEAHINNGYPEYLEDFNAGLIKTVEIEDIATETTQDQV